MIRRAVDGMDKALGKDLPDTLKIVPNLVSVLQAQGKYEMAEEINRRALDRMEKTPGEEHLDT